MLKSIEDILSEKNKPTILHFAPITLDVINKNIKFRESPYKPFKTRQPFIFIKTLLLKNNASVEDFSMALYGKANEADIRFTRKRLPRIKNEFRNKLKQHFNNEEVNKIMSMIQDDKNGSFYLQSPE